jgi:RNA polymerase sigma-70 factor (ECF subfamily)
VDDANLIQNVLDGRREDFEILVERYQRRLFGYVYRLTHDVDLSNDVVQVTFIRAYTRLAQFSGRASFMGWLYQIALNEFRSRGRRQRLRQEVPLENVSEADLATDSTETSNWRSCIETLVARLPLRQRNVMVLRVFQDLPFKEVARIEGISENSAKVNYHHAVLRLREWLKDAGS